jgi:hypothetical protein
MLGIEGAQLATDQKDSARGNLDKSDTDPEPPTKPPGFLSKIGSGVKGLAQRNSSLLKSLGLAGLIIAFSKYKTQITGFVEGALTYFNDLYNVFQSDGISGVIDQIGKDMTGIFKSIGNLLVKGFDSLMTAANKALFPEQYGGEESRYISGETLQSTGSEIVDNIILATGGNTFDENYNEALTNAQEMKQKANMAGKGNIGDGLLDLDVLDDYRELTKQSGGKIQWSVDLNDENIPYEDRMEAQPVVEGVEYTLKTLPDLGKVPPTNYDQVIKEKGFFEEIPTKSGSYNYLTPNEQIIKAREQIASDLSFIYMRNDRYGGYLGIGLSRRARILENQKILSNLGVENIEEYNKGNRDSLDFMNTYNNNRIELLMAINTPKSIAEAQELKKQVDIMKGNDNNSAPIIPLIDNSKTDNSVKSTSTSSIRHDVDSTSKEYVESMRFVGGR